MQQNQAKEEKSQKEQERLNRQINFFIMRYMWQVVRGRGKGTIYDMLYTSRERYTRVIDSGIIRFKAGELDKWHELTGISKDIFTGTEVFRCIYKEQDTQKEITQEEWEDYFVWRNGEKEKGSDQTILKNILNKLNNSVKDNPNNREFYALCYYLQSMKPAPLQTPDDVIKRILAYLNVLSFQYLDSCSYQKLEEMYSTLKEKYSMTTKIYQYKSLNRNKKKK